MQKAKFETLKKEFNDAMDSVLRAGLKFKFRGPFVNMSERRKFRKIMSENLTIEERIKALEEHLTKHEVLKAENDEFEVLHDTIKALALLYHAQFIILQDEYAHMNKERDEIKSAVEFFHKRNLPEPVMKKIYTTIDKMMDEWEDDFDKFRKEINAAWSRAKGGAGWARYVFDATKKQGYWMRRNERTKLSEALKAGAIVDADLKKLIKVKTQKEMDKLLNEIAVKSKLETQDYEMIEKMLSSTWDNINKNLRKATEIIYNAATQREMPALDKQEVAELNDMIVNKLEEHFLHALRIDTKQLEALLGEARSEEAGLKKAA